MQKLTPFHLAIPVDNISECREFYRDILGCEEGRSSDHWVDFNLFGHQLVIHYKEKSNEDLHTNPVDGKDVPVPHFGVILKWDDFEKFSKHLIENGIEFIIEPYIRFGFCFINMFINMFINVSINMFINISWFICIFPF